jgi:hypothetical protein
MNETDLDRQLKLSFLKLPIYDHNQDYLPVHAGLRPMSLAQDTL